VCTASFHRSPPDHYCSPEAWILCKRGRRVWLILSCSPLSSTVLSGCPSSRRTHDPSCTQGWVRDSITARLSFLASGLSPLNARSAPLGEGSCYRIAGELPWPTLQQGVDRPPLPHMERSRCFVISYVVNIATHPWPPSSIRCGCRHADARGLCNAVQLGYSSLPHHWVNVRSSLYIMGYVRIVIGRKMEEE
jgi:hypothetical protein